MKPESNTGEKDNGLVAGATTPAGSDLTNEEWERIALLLPPQKPKTGRPASDHRRIVNGILWVKRTGASWRRLPARYGSWRTVACRFYRWRKRGIWDRIFAAIQRQGDAGGAPLLKRTPG